MKVLYGPVRPPERPRGGAEPEELAAPIRIAAAKEAHRVLRATKKHCAESEARRADDHEPSLHKKPVRVPVPVQRAHEKTKSLIEKAQVAFAAHRCTHKGTAFDCQLIDRAWMLEEITRFREMEYSVQQLKLETMCKRVRRTGAGRRQWTYSYTVSAPDTAAGGMVARRVCKSLFQLLYVGEKRVRVLLDKRAAGKNWIKRLNGGQRQVGPVHNFEQLIHDELLKQHREFAHYAPHKYDEDMADSRTLYVNSGTTKLKIFLDIVREQNSDICARQQQWLYSHRGPKYKKKRRRRRAHADFEGGPYEPPVFSYAYFVKVWTTWDIKLGRLKVDTCAVCDKYETDIKDCKRRHKSDELEKNKKGLLKHQTLAESFKNLKKRDCRLAFKVSDAQPWCEDLRTHVPADAHPVDVAREPCRHPECGTHRCKDDPDMCECKSHDTKFGDGDYDEMKAVVDRGDRLLSNSDGERVLAFESDAPAVLCLPKLTSGVWYFLRKLKLQSYMIVPSVDVDDTAWLGVWDERQGGKGANAVLSCLLRWLLLIAPLATCAVWWADNTSAQVKNFTVLCWLDFLTNPCSRKWHFFRRFDLKFLLPGHSYMMVDRYWGMIMRAMTYVLYCATCLMNLISAMRSLLFDVKEMETCYHRNFDEFIGQMYTKTEYVKVMTSKYYWFNFGEGEIWDEKAGQYVTREHHGYVWARKTMDPKEQPRVIRLCYLRRPTGKAPVNYDLFHATFDLKRIPLKPEKAADLRKLLAMIPAHWENHPAAREMYLGIGGAAADQDPASGG